MEEIKRGVYRVELKTPPIRRKPYFKMRKDEVNKIKDDLPIGMCSAWSYHFEENYKYVVINTNVNFYE